MRFLFFFLIILGVFCGTTFYICNNTNVEQNSTCEIDDCCTLKEAVKKQNQEGIVDVEFFFSSGHLLVEESFEISAKNIAFSGMGLMDTIISSTSGIGSCIFHLLPSNYESIAISNIRFSQIYSNFLCSNISSKIQNARIERIEISNSLTPFVSFDYVELVTVKGVHLEQNTGDATFNFRSNDTEIFTNITNISSFESSNLGLLDVFSQYSHVQVSVTNLRVSDQYMEDDKKKSSSSIHVDGVGTSIIVMNSHFVNNQQSFLNATSRSTEGLQIQFESNNITRNTATEAVVCFWSESGDLSSYFRDNEITENFGEESSILVYHIKEGNGFFSILHEGNTFTSNRRKFHSVAGLDGCVIRINKEYAMEVPYIWMSHFISFHKDRFYDNKASNSYGGGVALTLPDRGLVNIKECVFDTNSVLGEEDIGGGGAISMNGLTEIMVNMFDTVFFGNKATYGGAIFCNDFKQVIFVIVNCTFEENQAISYHKDAYSRGGAIYVTKMNMRMKEKQSNFTIQILNSTFRSNHAVTGGAICNIFDSHLQILAYIINTAFEKNEAISDGGAILLLDSLIFIEKCDFVSNQCFGGVGGAIQTRGSDVLIVSTFFRDNLAKNYGGAIFSWMDDDLNIFECTFSNNSVWDMNLGVGGSLYIETVNHFLLDSSTRITNSRAGYGGGVFLALDVNSEEKKIGEMFAQITQNEAFVAGGGMYVWSGEPKTLGGNRENIFNNTALNGNDVMSMPWRFFQRDGEKKKNYCKYEDKVGSLYKYTCSMDSIEFFDIYNQSITQKTPKDYDLEIDFVGSDERVVDEQSHTRDTVDLQLKIILYDSQQKEHVQAEFSIYSMSRRYSSTIDVEFEVIDNDSDGNDDLNKTVFWIVVITCATLLPVLLLACFVLLVLGCWCLSRLICCLISVEKKRKKKMRDKKKDFYEEL